MHQRPFSSFQLRPINQFFWLALLAMILSLPILHADEIKVVEAGKAVAEIVVGEDATRVPKFAAKELQLYLQKISGAEVPIVSEPTAGTPVQVYVGKSRFTNEKDLKTEDLKFGAYRMASGNDWIALLGPDKDFEPIEPWGRSKSKTETKRVNEEFDKISGDTFWNNFRMLYARKHDNLGVWDYDDMGTLNAVYKFLRDLGVRWYAPGEIGEVVPEMTDISFPAKTNQEVIPDFPVRRISYFHSNMGKPELTLWNLRLGANYAQELLGVTALGHGIKFVIMRDEMKAKHPEMYALWGGERATGHKGGQGAPRLGSKLLKEKHLKYAATVFDHFKEPLISLDVVDGFSGRISEDDRDQATPERGWKGSMSDYYWGYVNSVASELYKSYPDRLVSGLLYSAYSLPPEKIETMSPNLMVIDTRHRSRLGNPRIREESRDLRKAWLKKLPSGKYMTWDYYLQAWPARNPGPPAYYPRLIAEDLKELKGVSLGDSIEVYDRRPNEELGFDEFAINHLNIYVTSRLWWDADLDIDAVLQDYYDNYYGPASAQMKAFIEFSESNWMTMKRDADQIAEAFALLETARKAAPQDSMYAERIDRIRQYMEPLVSLQAELKIGRQNIPEALASRREVEKLTFDGQLNDPFWEGVSSHSFKELKDGGVPKFASDFKVAVGTDGMLYLGIRCEDPDMAHLNSPSKDDGDAAIWSGDFVEILIETPVHSYYQICVGPAGNIMDIDRGDGINDGWKSGAEVRVHHGEKEWTIEMRIPPAGAMAAELDPNTGISGDLPTQDAPWYINVCRARARGVTLDLSAWSPTGGSFHKPVPQAQKAFGRLVSEPDNE